MREIKFRAWDKVNNKWMSVADLDEEIIINPYTSTSRAGQFSISEWNVVHRVSEDLGTTIILMQYTGLKDKNGVAIYEGDYLTTNRMYHKEDKLDGVVAFEAGAFTIGSISLHALWLAGDDIEVIGNIHENPELLKG